MSTRTRSGTGAAPKRVRAITRENVLVAAEEVFAAKGYRGASINEIAAEAGYTIGALYSNFASKAQLFMAVTERRMLARGRRLEEALRGVQDRIPVTTVAEIIWAELQPEKAWTIAGYEFVAEAMRDDSLGPRLVELNDEARDIVRDILVASMAGRPVPALPLERMVTLTQCLINGIAATATYDLDLDLTETLADGLALMLDGPGETS
ncbi:TetR/AcrR family transcriptional regulator [Jiangella anatolica]|uniref:HTH tetR-type domain-containing protein n=1 Tax=Jiangella anatolica TaxID=2670374 RepID=A0A2W2C945_9ACTN|nr:TetR/AcrR family transcriptional regulator [Jiangella anatolica]PZF84717.1 hypothetical protein C1I92_07570 [Jiangella anatolica]